MSVEQDHVTAVLALLDAAKVPPGEVYDGEVLQEDAGATPPAPPYVVAYLAHRVVEPAADPDTSSLGQMQSGRAVTTVYVHSVGGTAAAARAVAGWAGSALVDVVPTIAGRSCWPIRHEDGQPPRRDEKTGTAIFDKVDVYRLDSVPA